MLIGDRYGRLTVVYLDGPNAICRCDCGNEVSVRRKSLTSSSTRSCGCLRKKNIYKPGDRFGMLTVLSEQDNGKVLCRCDCGNEVSVRRNSLSSGNSKSCGCQRFKKKSSLPSPQNLRAP